MKEKNFYECTSCGYKTPKWMGKCPSCNEWNSFEQAISEKKKSNSPRQISSNVKISVSQLNQVETSKNSRIVTDVNEFNRVLGGGIVRDSISILTSPPGGGKSTLSLAI